MSAYICSGVERDAVTSLRETADFVFQQVDGVPVIPHAVVRDLRHFYPLFPVLTRCRFTVHVVGMP